MVVTTLRQAAGAFHRGVGALNQRRVAQVILESPHLIGSPPHDAVPHRMGLG